MYVNPRYRELTGTEPPTRSVSTATPPEESGRRLATLPRKKRGGPDEELRVSLETYQDHPYISVRVWTVDERGQSWPVKGKGVSIRLRECDEIIAALRTGVEMAERA